MAGSQAGDAGWDCSPKAAFQRRGCAQAGPRSCCWACWGKPRGQCLEQSASWHLPRLGAKERPLMRSPCQLREPGPSHCQIAAKGRDASLPNSRPCWPLRTSWSRLVRGCSPPLRQPFLFKGDLPQDLPEQREGERRRKGGACRDQSREKRPPPSPPRGGRRACPAQAGHPLPASCCRATVHAPLKATPRPRQAVLLTRPSRHPLSHRRGTGWEGCRLDAWVQDNAHLLQRLLGGGPWLAPP